MRCRLMEHYDLRSCFLPDLSGLHVRIHQFRMLLKQHLPTLSAHLDALQIEPAYVSQWFLSFFAVTCPLPMLFRIYDVIFAEGASVTIMRVALSLMRKNEEKIIACTEFEDVMQLLLSRGLWDCYHYNADSFVNDFVSLTGIVTNESLQVLEASYHESMAVDAASISETIGSAAQRFLGRLWAGPTTSMKPATLSPSLVAPSRPVSFMRRSPSKQSIASTMNSIEGGGSDSILSSSTEATSASRDSSNTDESSIRGQSVSFPVAHAPKSNKDKNLHGQIEDLLTALSEMQRDHAILATQLQREREEREEDRRAVKSLLDGLKKKSSSETVNSEDSIETVNSEDSLETVTATNQVAEEEAEEAVPQPEPVEPVPDEDPDRENSTPVPEDDISHLISVVEERFSPDTISNRRSSMLQSKSQLRDELARSKEQLIIEVSKSQDYARRLSESARESASLREELREAHTHIRTAHTEKQRLEKVIQELKSKERKSSQATPDSATQDEWPSPKVVSSGGLRELKLGRSGSNRSQKNVPMFTKRTSSLNAAAIMYKESECPSPTLPPPSPAPSESDSKKDADVDTLVLELVQAKTAEALARQEAEEAKGKLEALRKLLGMSTPSPSEGQRPSIQMGNTPYSSLSLVPPAKRDIENKPPASAGVSSGGFWAGWGKRSASTVEKSSAGL